MRPTPGMVAHTQGPASLDSQPKIISLEQAIPASPIVRVDFSSVYWASQTLKMCPLHPETSLPDSICLHPATELATAELCIPPEGICPRAFHFFVDGSKVSHGQVGSAVVLLCEYDVGTTYGGHLRHQVQDAQHAHLGEHSAMIWSLVWAIHCSDWILDQWQLSSVAFHFYFDATGTGYQAAGWWKTFDYVAWRNLMRAMVHILENRHGMQALHWQHVKAHNDHPWNELVDQLAKSASVATMGVPNCDPWYIWLQNETISTAMQWIWYLERLLYKPHLIFQLSKIFVLNIATVGSLIDPFPFRTSTSTLDLLIRCFALTYA